jgi:hypothetical protein
MTRLLTHPIPIHPSIHPSIHGQLACSFRIPIFWISPIQSQPVQKLKSREPRY